MIFRKALFIYKLYMVLYLLAAFNVFFNSGVLLKGATVIAAVFGAGMLVCVLFRWKQYRKMKNFFLCILFFNKGIFYENSVSISFCEIR